LLSMGSAGAAVAADCMLMLCSGLTRDQTVAVQQHAKIIHI